MLLVHSVDWAPHAPTPNLLRCHPIAAAHLPHPLLSLPLLWSQPLKHKDYCSVGGNTDTCKLYTEVQAERREDIDLFPLLWMHHWDGWQHRAKISRQEGWQWRAGLPARGAHVLLFPLSRCTLSCCSWRTGGRLLLLLWGAVCPCSRGVFAAFVLGFSSLRRVDAAGLQWWGSSERLHYMDALACLWMPWIKSWAVTAV